MSYTIPFSQLAKEEVGLGGGKATSLACMSQNGIPVPQGFVITTAAFVDFSANGPSEAFKKELIGRFRELSFSHVAVRSSAIAEDNAEASWAGQLETYLNVTENTLLESVKECWKSVQAQHALDYIKDKSISKDDMTVAVAVQGMVQSEVSGVMFTVDPIQWDYNRMIIEGIYGLGELIVQGIETPDSYVVTKDPFEVIDYSIQMKQAKMVYVDGENKTIKVAKEKADKSVLRETEVNELAEIGLRIEALYQKPQDIEWAKVGNEFFILQSRPITTLK